MKMKNSFALFFSVLMLFACACGQLPSKESVVIPESESVISSESKSVSGNEINEISEIEKAVKTLTQPQRDELGARYYPKAIRISGTAMFDTFSWSEEFSLFKDRGDTACIIGTVIGTTEGPFSTCHTYYNIQVNESILGDFKEGDTVTVHYYGYFDAKSGEWRDMHPEIVPPSAGDQILIMISKETFGDQDNGYGGSWEKLGYPDTIGGKEVIVFKSTIGTTVEQIKELLPEGNFAEVEVPNINSDTKTGDLLIVDRAAAIDMFRRALSK